MSKLLSIQWSHERLLVVGATPGAGNVQINRAFSIELPAEQATEKSIAETVARALRSNGFSRADAIVVLDRDCVEMRQFDVPPVPANELADLVHFQANTQFTSFNDSWALDYVPLGLDKDKQATSVLACALSPQLLAQIKECLETAGVKIRHITVRSFSSLSLANPKSGDGEQIIVQRVGDEVDMTAIEATNVLLTRTVKLPKTEVTEEIVSKITQEFKRTLASCSNQHARQNFDHVKVIGRQEDYPYFTDSILAASDVAIDFVDPTKVTHWKPSLVDSLSEPVSDYGPAVGSLVSKARNDKFVVDLLNPRARPREEKSNRRLYVAGGVAAGIAILIFASAYIFLSYKQKQMDVLAKQLSDLKTENKSSDQIIGEVEKIDQWKRGDINLLDELSKISDGLPLGDDAMVDDFNGNYNLTSHDYKLNLNGRITRPELSREIDNQLRNADYQVDPGADVPRAQDPTYKNDFKKALIISLLEREIEEYETEIPSDTESANKKNGSADKDVDQDADQPADKD